jgi:hypothetical protein
MDLSEFDVNDTAAIEGQWVHIGKGAELRIAKFNNEKYRDFVKKKMKPYRSAMRAGSVDESLITEIVVQAMSRHVLLDWKGLTERGEPLTYSIEKAEQLLRDKEPFRDLVLTLSQDAAMFQEAEVEDGEKNS